MKKIISETLPYVAPFATWFLLMMLLPTSAQTYAIRAFATFAVGMACLAVARPKCNGWLAANGIAAGILGGAAVCAVWIWLPNWPFAEPVASQPAPYDPAVCGWALTIAKLIGSAFIIAPAEEIFFRSFLYRRLIARDFTSVSTSTFDPAAFAWMVLIFTLEHDRPVAAAIAGATYGLLMMRFGTFAAIIAHVTTNLLLGLHVIVRGEWQFW